MRQRLFASLIVCVALLAQIGASFWGASLARDGFAQCHRPDAALLSGAFSSATATPGEDAAPDGGGGSVPVPHDHASCLLCQMGFAAVCTEAPAPPARSAAQGARAAPPRPGPAPVQTALNKSAAARAPPSSLA